MAAGEDLAAIRSFVPRRPRGDFGESPRREKFLPGLFMGAEEELEE